MRQKLLSLWTPGNLVFKLMGLKNYKMFSLSYEIGISQNNEFRLGGILGVMQSLIFCKLCKKRFRVYYE